MFRFLLIVAVPHVFAGANANAVVSLDWILDGGAGNQTDDGVHSGNVSGQGTKIAVEVFAQGVTTSLVGVKIEFDFDAAVLKFDGAANSAFAFIIPEATGVNFAGAAPVTLPKSGFLARAEFSTVADVTGKEFHLGIKSVTLAESAVKSDVVTSTSRINFNGVETTGTDTTGTDTGVNGLGAVNANVLFSPNAITATANTEVSIDVFIYGVNGIGGASIVFAFRPDSAVTLTGFTPIDGLELLGISGNEVVLGAEQGVMLSDKGYIGTLNLITGSAGGSFRVGCSSFTVLLGSGDVVLGPSRKKFVDADGEPVYIVKLESELLSNVVDGCERILAD